MAPRAQPFDESMDSLCIAIKSAQDAGFEVTLEKARGGAPGFANWGPFINHMLRDGDTHLFLAADDVIYPADTIVRLVNADKDVVCGIYRKTTLHELSPANFANSAEEFIEHFRGGGVYETTLASGHTMTIKRHVIEKMIADYPELAYEAGSETHYALALPMVQDGKCYQDDWAFSIRARQSGFTLWDDFGCKLQHYCAGFLGFEALG